MRIYRTFSPYPHRIYFDDLDQVIRMSARDHLYTLKENVFWIRHSPYNEKAYQELLSVISYQGKNYFRPNWLDVNYYRSENQLIYDEQGKAIEVDELQAAMLCQLPKDWDSATGYSFFTISDFEIFEFALYSYNHQNGETKSIKSEGCFYSATQIDALSICVLDDNFLSAYDQNLDEIWRLQTRTYDQAKGLTDRSKAPQRITNECFVINVGSFGVEPSKVIDDYGQERNMPIPKKGIVRSYRAKDGSVHWEREFEYLVDDVLVHEGRIFVFTFNRLMELEPETGDILTDIDTGLPRVLWENHAVVELFVAQDKLYIGHQKEYCILVYDVCTFDCIKRIDLPDMWRPLSFQIQHPETKDIFVGIRKMPAPKRDTTKNLPCHISGILQFNPDRLDEPFELEPMPDMTIELRPSADQEERDELWVEFDWPALDDALRFGEIFIQNECKVLGYSRNGHKPNKRFNGKVHWRYSGCSEPAEKVREYLAKFEQRFNDWANEEVLGGDRQEYCTIDAQYIESKT